MKKPKVVQPFEFTDMSRKNMVDLLNEKYPISIKLNEDLVNRVYAKYPIISKAEVAIIVKAIFSSFRDLLVLGKVLNFNNLFFNTNLHFNIQNHKKYGISPVVKVQLQTPPPLTGKPTAKQRKIEADKIAKTIAEQTADTGTQIMGDENDD